MRESFPFSKGCCMLMSGERICFITGAPRSGTSVFKKVFRGHPELNGCGIEAGYILEIYDALGQYLDSGGVHHALERLASHEFGFGNTLTNAYLDQYGDDPVTTSDWFLRVFRLVCEPPASNVVLLQYPGPGILRAEVLSELFPGCRFLVLQRDPRANVSSQLASFPSRNIVRSIRLWKQCYRASQRIVRELGPRVAVFKFEELVVETDRICQDACKFLGVQNWIGLTDFDVSVPEYTERGTESEVKRYSRFEPRMLSKWQRSLKAHEIQLIEQMCRREMKALGYVELRPHIDWLTYVPYVGAVIISQLYRKLKDVKRHSCSRTVVR